MEELCAVRWSLFQDSDGRILDEYTVRKIAYQKGISPDVRREVWLFLLGYYSFTSTSEERKTTDLEKRIGYDSLRATWTTTSFSPSNSFENYAEVIEKDSLRTDRDLDFFSDENIENVITLERILKTFLILHPEFGYIQGMSDILAPLTMVLSSEHQAFWCFDHVMKTMGAVFSDLTLSEPLANLARLCYTIDKPLYDHLNNLCEGEQWLFSYRWILLKFKRELSFDHICRLWECFWSNHASDNFPLLVMAAVLHQFRDELLVCSTNEELLQFSQSLNGKIPLPVVLSLAQSIFERLKSDDYCPHDIKSLLSNESFAPPPLVGFVRTRQKFTTLHSNKMEVQRHQIWKSLFGDTPVQSVTSPFMLSPASTLHSLAGTASNSDTTEVNTLGAHELDRVSMNHEPYPSRPPITAPPKAGFVPREREIQFRDDIRKTVHHIASDGDSSFLFEEQPDNPEHPSVATTTDHVESEPTRSDVDTVKCHTTDEHHLHNGFSTPPLGESNSIYIVNERVHTSLDTCTGNTTTTASAVANGGPCDSRGCGYASHSVDGELQFDELRSEAQLICHHTYN